MTFEIPDDPNELVLQSYRNAEDSGSPEERKGYRNNRRNERYSNMQSEYEEEDEQ